MEADDQEGLAEFLERRVEDATRRAKRGAPPSAAAVLPLVRLRVILSRLPAVCVKQSFQPYHRKRIGPPSRLRRSRDAVCRRRP